MRKSWLLAVFLTLAAVFSLMMTIPASAHPGHDSATGHDALITKASSGMPGTTSAITANDFNIYNPAFDGGQYSEVTDSVLNMPNDTTQIANVQDQSSVYNVRNTTDAIMIRNSLATASENTSSQAAYAEWIPAPAHLQGNGFQPTDNVHFIQLSRR